MLLRRGALPKTETYSVPTLYAGDHLSQPEFHRRYEQYPDDVKIELIHGTVYMASPQRLPHGKYANKLSGILYLYEMQTPGVEAADESTVVLGPKSEPRPDLFLRVLPELGGNTSTEDDYVYGGPELIIEIAHSTVAIDLHQKKDDYECCGVAEYLVVCLEERQVCWFDLARGRTHSLPADGILRSKRFPGLWIDTQALFQGDSKRMAQILNEGLMSPEHNRFVRRLGKAAETKAKRKKRPRKNGQ